MCYYLNVQFQGQSVNYAHSVMTLCSVERIHQHCLHPYKHATLVTPVDGTVSQHRRTKYESTPLRKPKFGVYLWGPSYCWRQPNVRERPLPTRPTNQSTVHFKGPVPPAGHVPFATDQPGNDLPCPTVISRRSLAMMILLAYAIRKSKFFLIHQLMHKTVVLRTILKLTLKQLRHVSV